MRAGCSTSRNRWWITLRNVRRLRYGRLVTDGVEHDGPPLAADEADGDFSPFVLVGDEFDGPGLPLSSVRAAEYYREALLEAAKEWWRNDNPGRRRVPAGFASAFDLRLTQIRSGSADLGIRLHKASWVDEDDWENWSPAYLGGRDDLVSTVAQMRSSKSVPSNVSNAALDWLRKIGNVLSEDSFVVLDGISHDDSPSASGRAILDLSTRQLLEDMAKIIPHDEESETSLVGVITEYDGGQKSFQLSTLHGVCVCWFDETMREVAERAYAYTAVDGVVAPDVEVTGWTVEPDARRPTLSRVTSIEVMRSWGEKALLGRADSISGLATGWRGEGSVAPSRLAIERLRELARPLGESDVNVSAIPLPDGGISLERVRGDVELTATLRADGDVYFIADNTVTDELWENAMSYDGAEVAGFLQRGEVSS